LLEPDGEVRYVIGFAADVESTSESETTGIDDHTLTAFSSNLNTVRVPNGQFARSGKVFRSNPTLNSLLSAPILQFEHTIGWLYAIDKQEADEFSEADERLALTLAGQLAVAYENARLYEEAREHASVLQAEVAERKRAQEEKEKLLLSEKAARLEAEAAQRLSSQLLMREEEARADAETANRLKDEFLATVSHELRTPLNSILGWSQLMRSGKLDDEAEGRALTTIERNTRALAQIIDDLLDVSRIISGKLRLDVGPIELEPVVAAALDTIKPATDAKNIELHVLLDSSTGTILGDPNRLQQVVWNLLTNAIKFTQRGGRVEVRLERVDASARITVSDTGEGISEDFLPYIFDRFRQADSTFTRLHGGLGLGLAIVRHLVEMHGGSVSADSPGKGEGATFSVWFPVSTATWGSRSTPREVTEWHPTSQEDFELAGLTVLV